MVLRNWGQGRELIPEPTDYESVALPIELPRLSWSVQEDLNL